MTTPSVPRLRTRHRVVEAYRLDRYDNYYHCARSAQYHVVEAYRLDWYDNICI